MGNDRNSARRPRVKAITEKKCAVQKNPVQKNPVQQDTFRMDICSLIGELYFQSCVPLSQKPDWGGICDELKAQTISLLFSDLLIQKNLDAEVLERWRKTCFGSFHLNVKILDVQQWLNVILIQNQIPFIVVKGAAAAVLYPRPILREQGDIDIVVAPEHFREAMQVLLREGCEREVGEDSEDENSRHFNLYKDGIVIELHSRFAKLSTQEAEALLDGWIFDAIGTGTVEKEIFGTRFPSPPDELNGLILLTHINMHLEEGLGFRQIIDWMLYVYRCLDDEKWPAFRAQASQLGLEKLAMAVTRMCQLYLGLPDTTITWCRRVDKELCVDLLEYLFECGNFGYKNPTDNTAAMVISHGRGVRGFFRNLQHRGEVNWELYKKHVWLKPFAWIYQGFRYAKIALGRKDALTSLKKSVEQGKKRGDLLDRLGATSLARKK